MSANLFYVDLYNAIACKSASGDSLAFSDWVAGGTVSFGLRFLDYVGGFNEVDADIAALRVSVGEIDSRPVSGRYKIKVGVTASTGANTTAFLDWNASAATVKAALNALSARPDNFSCDDANGSILIRREDGAAVTLAITSNRLIPRSFGRITGSEIDGEWVYDLRLTVAPLSFSDSATRLLPDAPTITTIQNGGTDPSGTTIWNEIQALYIPPNFRGTYQLRYGYGKTVLLDSTDGPTQLQDALNTVLAMVAPASTYGSAGTCTVTNPATNIAHIEFGGGLAGLNLVELVVGVFSAPPGDWTFDLPLNLSELREAMRDKASVTVPFEAEADFYLDSSDQAAGTVTRKLWSTTVTIKRPLIWPDMAVVPGVDWLFPNPTDYLPFSADQVITGQQHYAATLGNGTTTVFVLTHGLATTDISGIVVRENSTGAVLEPASYDATITDANTVTLVFTSAPASSGVRAIITAAGPTSAFVEHHHAIAEIGDTVEGTYVPTLQNVLDDFGSRIERLETLIGRADVAVQAVSSGNQKAEYSLPSVGEILPDLNNEDSVSTVASQVSGTAGVPQELATGATGTLGIKVAGNYTTDFLASATAWTKCGSGSSTTYTFDLTLNTTEMAATFSEDPASVSAVMEIEWAEGDLRTSSNTLAVTLENDIVRGDEGILEDGSPRYPLPGEIELVANKGVAGGYPSLDETGKVPAAQLPPASIDSRVRVADDAARFALTTDDVQDGDYVFQTNTSVLYEVTDAANLDNANGYTALATVPWGSVTGKPDTFPPSTHTHAIADTTGLQAELDGKASSSQGALADNSVQRGQEVSALSVNYANSAGHATHADTSSSCGTASHALYDTNGRDLTACLSDATAFAAAAHKSAHATGGSDQLTPSDIGAPKITEADSAPGSASAGDLWFDSTSARLMVRYGGAWVACSGSAGPTSSGFANVYEVFEHFENARIGPKWSMGSNDLGGTGAAYIVDGKQGVFRHATGTTASANQRAGLQSNGSVLHLGQGTVMRCTWNQRFAVLPNATDTGVIRFGFIDSGSTESTDGAFYRLTDAGNLYAVTRSNNVETSMDCGFRPDSTTWYSLGVEINAAGTAATFYNGATTLQTITTNIPTGSGRQTGIGTWINRTAATATSLSVDVDWLHVKLTYPTALVL